MGGTCSINAGRRLASGEGPNATVRLVIAQHPGVCGPTGPPPWPFTWLPSDLHKASQRYPLLFTTATNDAAFGPAPQTAGHELGCVRKAKLNSSTLHGHVAVQFSSAACDEDGAHPPFGDSGHLCPFKTAPEAPWVLTALKLYAQHDASPTSRCAAMLWGAGDGSLARDTSVDERIIYPPVPVPVPLTGAFIGRG